MVLAGIFVAVTGKGQGSENAGSFQRRSTEYRIDSAVKTSP